VTRQQIRLTLALIVAIILSIAFVDHPLAVWIDQHMQPWMRVVGGWLEEAGKSHWVLGYSLIAVAVAWRSWRSVAHRHIALFTAVAASGILANILKVIVVRPRPPLFLSQGAVDPQWFTFLIDWGWNSFPSGHATTGIAIAIAGAATWPRAAWLMWVLGFSIAVGRLIYNVHFLSDVLAGILLGAVVSWWCVTRLPRESH